MVLSSVQAVSADVDIEMFVKAKSTGIIKPPGVTFRPYNSRTG